MPSPRLCDGGARASTRWHISETGESCRLLQKMRPSDVQRPRAWRCAPPPERWSRGAASAGPRGSGQQRAPGPPGARSSIWEQRESFCTARGRAPPAPGEPLPYPHRGERRLGAAGGSVAAALPARCALEPVGEPGRRAAGADGQRRHRRPGRRARRGAGSRRGGGPRYPERAHGPIAAPDTLSRPEVPEAPVPAPGRPGSGTSPVSGRLGRGRGSPETPPPGASAQATSAWSGGTGSRRRRPQPTPGPLAAAIAGYQPRPTASPRRAQRRPAAGGGRRVPLPPPSIVCAGRAGGPAQPSPAPLPAAGGRRAPPRPAR